MRRKTNLMTNLAVVMLGVGVILFIFVMLVLLFM
jgi:hypothetical protein